MSLSQALHNLRVPFAALALCALLGQQLVGFVVTASPALAADSGISLCLSDPLPSEGAPMDRASGPGFCPCTLGGLAGIVPAALPLAGDALQGERFAAPGSDFIALAHPAQGPPPARAPPTLLHI